MVLTLRLERQEADVEGSTAALISYRVYPFCSTGAVKRPRHSLIGSAPQGQRPPEDNSDPRFAGLLAAGAAFGSSAPSCCRPPLLGVPGTALKRHRELEFSSRPPLNSSSHRGFEEGSPTPPKWKFLGVTAGANAQQPSHPDRLLGALFPGRAGQLALMGEARRRQSSCRGLNLKTCASDHHVW